MISGIFEFQSITIHEYVDTALKDPMLNISRCSPAPTYPSKSAKPWHQPRRFSKSLQIVEQWVKEKNQHRFNGRVRKIEFGFSIEGRVSRDLPVFKIY